MKIFLERNLLLPGLPLKISNQWEIFNFISHLWTRGRLSLSTLLPLYPLMLRAQLRGSKTSVDYGRGSIWTLWKNKLIVIIKWKRNPIFLPQILQVRSDNYYSSAKGLSQQKIHGRSLFSLIFLNIQTSGSKPRIGFIIKIWLKMKKRFLKHYGACLGGR